MPALLVLSRHKHTHELSVAADDLSSLHRNPKGFDLGACMIRTG